MVAGVESIYYRVCLFYSSHYCALSKGSRKYWTNLDEWPDSRNCCQIGPISHSVRVQVGDEDPLPGLEGSVEPLTQVTGLEAGGWGQWTVLSCNTTIFINQPTHLMKMSTLEHPVTDGVLAFGWHSICHYSSVTTHLSPAP